MRSALRRFRLLSLLQSWGVFRAHLVQGFDSTLVFLLTRRANGLQKIRVLCDQFVSQIIIEHIAQNVCGLTMAGYYEGPATSIRNGLAQFCVNLLQC